MSEQKTAHVGACEVSKVNEAAFRVNYERITGKTPGPGAQLSSLVGEVEAKYAAAMAADPEANLEKCTDCGGWSSPADVPEACPYCNDMKTGLSDEAQAFLAEKASEDDEETAIDSVALERQVEEIKNGAAKAPEQKMARRLPAAAPPSPPRVPLVALAGGKSAGNRDELDRSIAKFRAAGGVYANANYEAGEELARMHDHALWMQALNENGKPKYKNFEQFMKGELGISKTVGNRLIAAVASFKKEDFAKLGFETAAMIAGAPQEMHDQLLREAESGSSTREILTSVRQKKEALGIVARPPETPGAARTSAATVAAAKARKEKREASNREVIEQVKERAAITVGLKTNTFTSKLMTRSPLPGQPPLPKGTTREVVIPEHLREALATLMRDEQWHFQVAGVNGVVLTQGILVDPVTGHVTAKGDARRVKDEEDEAAA